MSLLKYEWLDTALPVPDDSQSPHTAMSFARNDERVKERLHYIIKSMELLRRRRPTKKEIKKKRGQMENAACMTGYVEGQHWKRRKDGTWDTTTDEMIDEMLCNDGVAMPSDTEDDTPDTSVYHLSQLDLQDQLQTDMGANISATNDRGILRNFREIVPKTVQGINDNLQHKAKLTGIGEYPLRSTDGETIRIDMYYGEGLSGTVISPTAVTKQHQQRFHAYMIYANTETNTGELRLVEKKGGNPTTVDFPLFCVNDLWYHGFNTRPTQRKKRKSTISATTADPQGSVVIHSLSDAAKFELWHQRCAHRGRKTLENLHKHAIGVPKLRGNAFWKCPSCLPSKLCTKIDHSKSDRQSTKTDENGGHEKPKHDEEDDIFLPNARPGQHFHMDFGFVRGKGFDEKDYDGRTITSIDGFNSYLLVIDRATRYTWTFLTKTKDPPIMMAQAVLSKFKSDHPHKTVRTDQGRELGKSSEFRTMIAKEGFHLELTGADASNQNGIAERPNRTLGEMMRCMLHGADLGPGYWSYALLHATYIMNRMPHSSLNKSPYEALTGSKPNLTRLRVFGSRVCARKTGKRPYKLDNHSYQGVFLGCTATPKNIYVKDDHTRLVKIGTHVVYDEAHMTVPAIRAPLAAQALQRLGYHRNEKYVEEMLQAAQEQKNRTSIFQIELLSDRAQAPIQATKESVGYDVFSAKDDFEIGPGETAVVPLDIKITPPQGCYIRIAPRSGLTVKKNLTTMAGVIDPDYTGNVAVVLHNFGSEEQKVGFQDKVAQIIFEKVETPTIEIVEKVKENTSRGEKGFGSTDMLDESAFTPITAAAAKLDCNMQLSFEVPYDLILSNDPYDNHTSRMIDLWGKHPTLGLALEWSEGKGRARIMDIEKGTPAARLQRWRSELRGGYISTIGNKEIKSLSHFKEIVENLRENDEIKSTKLAISTITKQNLHPQEGIPQIYNDQLNVIAQHLWEMKYTPMQQKDETSVTVRKVKLSDNSTAIITLQDLRKARNTVRKVETKKVPKKLTRRYLVTQTDWSEWRSSEAKQLQQYEDQGTFGDPEPYPKGANLLNLLWTYNIKDDGRKKARCVCNGAPNQKGTVTLGETYAASLEQSGARVFWATAALRNMIIMGADASNAFAEAPPPKAPLYVKVDKPFREWWEAKGRPPIPEGHVLRVKGALQGHPESPRLWAKLIDSIIRQLNLKPCKHEPCLYYTNNYNGTGKTVLFLRQVDDFAVACEDEELSQQVIADINNKMTIDVKHLGKVSRFNGVDIDQTREYIKIHNQTYIEKLIDQHHWLEHEHGDKPLGDLPLPMRSDAEYLRSLEQATAATEDERHLLEREYGFKYRQGIGEIIYAMVTCRPDISFAVIKLSQYSTKPARLHFEAVKHLYRYLKATKTEGIYYWRKKLRHDLPKGQLPRIPSRIDDENSEPCIEKEEYDGSILVGAVDSDHAGDTAHRRSVSGMIHKIAGGVIIYKTKYQDVVATSSSEAEFIAAVEAAKQSLYLRTILDEIGIPQEAATTLYEDNQGALMMANAQQPTKRTRHMDIRNFALQDWIERDLLVLKRIQTSHNYADAMTKALARTLFYKHMTYIQGKHLPAYAKLARISLSM